MFQATDGNFFSYGYHYPLLICVDGVWFRNIRGYSNTTARHISWAGDAVPSYDVILPNRHREHYPLNKETVFHALMDERREVETKLKTLSKRAFRQREILLDREDQIAYALEALR